MGRKPKNITYTTALNDPKKWKKKRVNHKNDGNTHNNP